MPRFKSKKPRIVTPPSPAQEVVPAARQGSSPTGSDNSDQQVSSEGSRRASPGTLGARFIQEVKRGGSAVRRGLVNLGEGFGSRTPSASMVGAGDQRSTHPSPPPPAAPSSETASDRLAPLPSTPKKGLRSKTSFSRLPRAGFKRAASESMSDSEGSVSGSSRGPASTGTTAARLTDLGPVKDTALNSSAGASEMLLTPPSTPSTRLPFPPAEADSPTPAPKIRHDAPWKGAVVAKADWSADPTNRPGRIVDPRYPSTPADPNQSDDTDVDHLLMSSNRPAPEASSPTAECRSAALQRQEQVLQLRDMLTRLFFGLDRQTRWYPMLKEIADCFAHVHGQDADCSGLIEATPPEKGELEAPQPVDDSDALRKVRESFLKMAPHLIRYLETGPHSPHVDEELPWNLPPAAREDPRAFWAKIFDSFDFSSPQYFDTTLPLEQQPKDAFNYLINFDILSSVSLAWKLGRPRSPDNLEFDEDAEYEQGCRMLNEMLDLTFGIRVRPRKQEAAIPFPWLDCGLSRFTAFGWTYQHEWDPRTVPYWEVDYKDAEHPYDPLHRSLEDDDHFLPYIWCNLLVTNVRVPLPVKVQNCPALLGDAMMQVYSEFHPIQMLEAARTLIQYLHGDECSDTDLRAAMLYQVISRLSISKPDFFDILLEEKP